MAASTSAPPCASLPHLNRRRELKTNGRVAIKASRQEDPDLSQMWSNGAVVGVLGGGQLGRMLCEAAAPIGVKVAVLDPSNTCCATALAHRHVVADFSDKSAVLDFAKACTVVTTEFEHVDVETLQELERHGVRVEPSSSTIQIIQDKYLQKLHFRKHGIPVAEFVEITDEKSLEDAASVLGYPFMLKSRRLAYDGRGNFAVRDKDDLLPAVNKLGGFGQGLYAEKWASFEKELAIMVARSRDGRVVCYQPVETTQKSSICHTVLAPAQVSRALQQAALDISKEAVTSLAGAGVFGVELFLLPNGQLLLNEVAPRPHNSGHLTIEACYVSQFEQHLRAVLGLPLGDTSMKVSAAGMYNLLAEEAGEVGASFIQKTVDKAFAVSGASVHWYDKQELRRQRKMGHVTVVEASMAALKAKLHEIERGSEADRKHQPGKPAVGIIMGSDSDISIMKHAAEVLESFGINYQMTIVSAHRTVERMQNYASKAHLENLKVIIAGAGGAAHLPGMVGSITPLPSIGVPVNATAFEGLDSFLSIVQMPAGIPVATVAVDDAKCAGLMAVRVLATSDERLQKEVIASQGEELITQNLRRLLSSEACCSNFNFNTTAVVGILRAGQPDCETVEKVAAVLKSFGVPCEIAAVSSGYVKEAHLRKLKVLVVVSSGYSELTGIVAGATPLPVIGVPTSNGPMPRNAAVVPQPGVPVAWVAVNNGVNAGLLAARFLQISDPKMLDKMIQYKGELERTVREKADKLEAMGWRNYVSSSLRE